MLSIRYTVVARTEAKEYCEARLRFVPYSPEARRQLPADFQEACIAPYATPEALTLTLPMSEWENYPVGAEFDLVPGYPRARPKGQIT